MEPKIMCKGCLSIKNLLFPFCDEERAGLVVKGVFIEQEGCGIDGETYLRIKFCPVCGKEIK